MGDREALEAAQPELAGRSLPADMLTTSASGLDPDISPANAILQVDRVANARGVPAGGDPCIGGATRDRPQSRHLWRAARERPGFESRAAARLSVERCMPWAARR